MFVRRAAAAAAAGIAFVTLSSVVALMLFPQLPVLALLPVLAACALWLLLKAPTKLLTLGLFAGLMLLHSPHERPFSGLWVSPLEWLGVALVQNLSSSTGIGPLAFAGVDLLTAWLLVRAFVEQKEPLLLPRPLLSASVMVFATVCALVLFGVAGGGSANAAYWQLRELIFAPLFVLLFVATGAHAELSAVGWIVVGTAVAKAAFAMFFVTFIGTGGVFVEYITTHADSVHFVLALAIVGARWMEAPSARRLAHAAVVAAPLMYAMLVNERRLAWVALFGAGVICFALAPRSAARRLLARAAVACIPLVLLYGAAGWTSSARVFAPVQTVRSLGSAEADGSTRWRDIENFNLIMTIRRVPLLGQGFGLPYDEVVKAPDISRQFELYRYIPHNTVLSMLSTGGMFGFGVMLVFFWTAAYCAARAHRFAATDARVRTAASVSLCTLFAFLVQCFGDMGTQSWTAVAAMSMAVAVAGRLSLVTGAMPATARLKPVSLLESAS